MGEFASARRGAALGPGCVAGADAPVLDALTPAGGTILPPPEATMRPPSFAIRFPPPVATMVAATVRPAPSLPMRLPPPEATISPPVVPTKPVPLPVTMPETGCPLLSTLAPTTMGRPDAARRLVLPSTLLVLPTGADKGV